MKSTPFLTAFVYLIPLSLSTVAQSCYMQDNQGLTMDLGSLCQSSKQPSSTQRRQREYEEDYDNYDSDGVELRSPYHEDEDSRYYGRSNDSFDDPSYRGRYNDPFDDPGYDNRYNDPFEDPSYNGRYNDPFNSK